MGEAYVYVYVHGMQKFFQCLCVQHEHTVCAYINFTTLEQLEQLETLEQLEQLETLETLEQLEHWNNCNNCCLHSCHETYQVSSPDPILALVSMH